MPGQGLQESSRKGWLGSIKERRFRESRFEDKNTFFRFYFSPPLSSPLCGQHQEQDVLDLSQRGRLNIYRSCETLPISRRAPDGDYVLQGGLLEQL